MGSEKMSKSLGNVTLIHDLLKDWDGEVIRLALLKAHYRSELQWSEDLLKESKSNLDSAYSVLKDFKKLGIKNAALDERDNASYNILEIGRDDLNLMNPIGYLSHFPKRVNGELSLMKSELDKSSKEKHSQIKKMYFSSFSRIKTEFTQTATLLGLLQKDPEDWFKGGASSEDEARFDAIAKRRETARAEKNWAEADAARDEAKALGIVLEDGPEGTSWRKG